MSIPFAGRAIVTGAVSGLGRAITRELANRKWEIATVDCKDKSDEAWVALDREVIASGGRHLASPFDVRDGNSWHQLANRLQKEWPTIDLLVNAAGVGATGEVGSLPVQQWQRVLETNLLGTVIGCETFLPRLRSQRESARLLNIASIAGLLSPPSMAAYSASKAGVIAVSDAIAAESQGQLSVTVACPGFFRSGLLDSWYFTQAIERREAARRMKKTAWTSESVAQHVLAATFRGQYYVVLGRQAQMLWFLKRCAPTLTNKLTSYLYRRCKPDAEVLRVKT
ncbi:MAG: SDR family NAD(P)-dependent oxidoreductase [Planctomycetaceae bacterium]|nr:SDR family NAD(P)-dependent oxidoreductase [Planctomycetaceae bacterium]